MTYSHIVRNTVDDLNGPDWDRVCSQSNNPFMDRRFLRAVERSVVEPGKYWYAVIYDEARQPVAAACFSLYQVDAALMAPAMLQRFVRSLRKVFPRFFRFKILIGGMPVSTSGGQVAATSDVDTRELAIALDTVACQLARSERAFLISFKEYDREWTVRLSGLSEQGYRCAESVVTYRLDTPFDSFDAYYQSRSKRTRANMRKVFRKFEEAGFTCAFMKGGDETVRRYTEKVHLLYEAVYERAEVKFEHLPSAFFRELARQMPEEVRFTFLYDNDDVVGFCCALATDQRYDMLYCGINYERNSQADIYFNIMYRALEYGLAESIAFAFIGASADEFKRRMGSQPVPLYLFVKAPGAIPSFLFNRLFRLMFAECHPDGLDQREGQEAVERSLESGQVLDGTNVALPDRVQSASE